MGSIVEINANLKRLHATSVGHISPLCWSKPKASSKQSNQWLCADSTRSTDEPLYCITDHSSCPVYQVELKLNDHPLAMEIDTGAGVSIASEAKIANLLPKLKLEHTHTRLRTYTGDYISVKGVTHVDVTYGEQKYFNLELLVVQGNGPCLFGRDKLRKISSSSPMW